MTKKHKAKKSFQTKPVFIESHWEQMVIILFLILPLIYFAQFLNADKMIAGSDYLIGGYPFEKWTAEQEEMPLWYPHVFGGVPVLGAPVGGPLAPLAQLREIIPPHVVLALSFIIFFFLAGLGMYLYLKEIGLSPYSAALGAVAYQFIGNLASTPAGGHAGRAASIALFPLMLFFIHCGLQSKKLLHFLLAALVTAFAFYEGHFQITYYALLFILGYTIYYVVAHRKENTKKDIIKLIGYGVAAIIVMCLLMAAVWLPVLGGLGTAARGVERGYEYATSWSLPPRELIDLFIPTYSGLLSNYWGINHFKMHIEYFGILSLIFALFTIILYWKRPYVRFYAAEIIVVLLVALGGYTPFFRIFHTIIPGFRLFRAPALVFYLVSFGFIVLAAIGFDTIFVRRKDGNGFIKKFYIIAGTLIGVCAVTAFICSVSSGSIIQSMQENLRSEYLSALGPRITEAKMTNIRVNFPEFISGIWRSLAFLIAILIMMYLSIKHKIKVWIFAIAAMTITLIDQVPLVAKFLPTTSSPKVYYAADEVVRFIQKDKGVLRVFPTPWYGHSTDLYLLYHNIQSAGGYIPNPIQRYQEFIGAGTSVMFIPSYLIQYPKFVDMLNVKYVIGPTLPEDISRYDMQTQKVVTEIKEYLSNFNIVFKGRQYSVYENESVLPRAYIVPDYYFLKESDVLNMLKSEAYDPRQAVIIEHDPHIPHQEIELPFVEVAIGEYSANRVVCNTDCSHSGFLVLLDNWHPDWKVLVDGEERTLYRANYTFRAVHLTGGNHRVVFAYISPYFNIGRIISIVAFILSVVACILLIGPKRLPLKK